ncbi:MAG: tryptophan--tRNA ligase [Patescibacteria group bacterium]
MAKKPIILSGIQPSGELHIGNYLGSLKNFVELQNSGDYDCYFFVADLHAMTENYNPLELAKKTRGVVLDYLAAGLDPKKSTIFIQSQVVGHTELAWIFNTLSPMGELERMTQYKDKAARQKENVNVGLFVYPVLQAADILMYHGELVPVGYDQLQHVELTRSEARWFNNKYGQTFIEPKPLLTKTPKIMSLLDPEKKMSKSLGPGHYIGINESPVEIKQKLKRAVSDEGHGNSAGGKNLLLLLENFSPKEIVSHFQTQQKQGQIKFGELKERLADDIANYFAPFRDKRQELEKDKKQVDLVISGGNKKAQVVADKTIIEVKKKVGLI